MSRTTRTKSISSERKAAFYLGGTILVVGLLIFASSFYVIFSAMGGGFDEQSTAGKSFAARAFGGFALIVVGGFIRMLGSRGLAGSGVVLNPDKAREDLSPYSRMAGGMAKDALDEADINLGQRPDRVVVVRCQKCSWLNEEDSKFCQECGGAL